MRSITQAIGIQGAPETLQALHQSSESFFSFDAASALMSTCGVHDTPTTLAALVESNLLYQAPQGFAISHLGRRTSLLVEAIVGADLRDVWRRLANLDPSLRSYELLRNNLTDTFLQSLITRPSFGRLYLCSPWIGFDQRRQGLLTHALLQSQRSGDDPEILVIMRPERDRSSLPTAATFLKGLGATIYFNRSLHSKLYIREPGRNGGYLMAILGSQNLTKSRYLELGVKIGSDSTLVQKLVAYFFDVASQSDEA